MIIPAKRDLDTEKEAPPYFEYTLDKNEQRKVIYECIQRIHLLREDDQYASITEALESVWGKLLSVYARLSSPLCQREPLSKEEWDGVIDAFCQIYPESLLLRLNQPATLLCGKEAIIVDMPAGDNLKKEEDKYASLAHKTEILETKLKEICQWFDLLGKHAQDAGIKSLLAVVAHIKKQLLQSLEERSSILSNVYDGSPPQPRRLFPGMTVAMNAWSQLNKKSAPETLQDMLKKGSSSIFKKVFGFSRSTTEDQEYEYTPLVPPFYLAPQWKKYLDRRFLVDITRTRIKIELANQYNEKLGIFLHHLRLQQDTIKERLAEIRERAQPWEERFRPLEEKRQECYEAFLEVKENFKTLAHIVESHYLTEEPALDEQGKVFNELKEQVEQRCASFDRALKEITVDQYPLELVRIGKEAAHYANATADLKDIEENMERVVFILKAKIDAIKAKRVEVRNAAIAGMKKALTTLQASIDSAEKYNVAVLGQYFSRFSTGYRITEQSLKSMQPGKSDIIRLMQDLQATFTWLEKGMQGKKEDPQTDLISHFFAFEAVWTKLFYAIDRREEWRAFDALVARIKDLLIDTINKKRSLLKQEKHFNDQFEAFTGDRAVTIESKKEESLCYMDRMSIALTNLIREKNRQFKAEVNQFLHRLEYLIKKAEELKEVSQFDSDCIKKIRMRFDEIHLPSQEGEIEELHWCDLEHLTTEVDAYNQLADDLIAQMSARRASEDVKILNNMLNTLGEEIHSLQSNQEDSRLPILEKLQQNFRAISNDYVSLKVNEGTFRSNVLSTMDDILMKNNGLRKLSDAVYGRSLVSLRSILKHLKDVRDYFMKKIGKKKSETRYGSLFYATSTEKNVAQGAQSIWVGISHLNDAGSPPLVRVR